MKEPEMRARWPVFATFAALSALYLIYPYVTLYRLDVAVREKDAEALRSMVDWYAVREGLKEDLCDMVLDEPASQRPSNELAPFGASFVRGITGSMLDHTVTPETVVSLTHAAGGERHEDARVVWAFFDAPTRFMVHVRTDASAEPIRVALELRDLRWRVRRVWLPNTLLERASSGT
jgi:hypothetical protein